MYFGENKMSRETTEFIIYIINEIANVHGKSTSAVYRILEQTGCIQKYLAPFYDVLHTMSSQAIIDDVERYVRSRGESL